MDHPNDTDPSSSKAPSAPAEVMHTANAPEALASLARMCDVEVELTLEIGRTRMKIGEVLKLAPGQTLELAKQAGEPLDILINGKLFGRGEAVLLGDRYGLRIVEVVGGEGHRS